MKIFISFLYFLILVSCSNNQSTYSVDEVVNKMKKYNDKELSLRGYLKISEMFRKFLYLEPDSDQFFDLAFHLEILPREQYIPETYYFVEVIGKFTDYTLDDGIIFMGAISPFGRVDVESIEHCENWNLIYYYE